MKSQFNIKKDRVEILVLMINLGLEEETGLSLMKKHMHNKC